MNKEILIDLYNNQFKTKKEIGILLNLDRRKLNKLFSIYKIITRKTKAKCNVPSKEILSKQYELEKLTINQLCSFYSVGKRTISKWLKNYNIPLTTSAQKKFQHLRRHELTDIQKQITIGAVLGDSYLSRTGNFFRLCFAHSEKQIQYLNWKKQQFINLIPRRIIKTEQQNSNMYCCCTIGHSDFKFFHDLFYENRKIIRPELVNYLTPLSMAIWYMDDGSSKPYCMKLSTEGFTKKENEILRLCIYLNFNIECKVCQYNTRGKTYNYLFFNNANSKKLVKLIRPYIDEIGCMRYKIPKSLRDDDKV